MQVFLSGEVGGKDKKKVCHGWFQSWPIKSAPLIPFKTAVTQHIVNSVTAEEGENRCCQPNLTQEETDILVWEVQARNYLIYGTTSKPPRADEAKLAWEEVTNIVYGSSPGVLRTAAHGVMMLVHCLIHIQKSQLHILYD